VSDVLRLQAFLRATAAPGRRVLELPPFTAYLDRDDPMRFLNYAIPEDGAEPDAAAVERLRAGFREHGRLPRLEWVEEAAPAVAPVLEACGMQLELNTPLMSCRPDELVSADADVPALTVASIGDGDIRDALNLQHVAFGGEPLPDDEEPRDPRRRGGGAVIARSNGEAVAAATWTAVRDEASEIVGVATVEAWRRRGLAGAVTAAAARDAFAAGASLCVLSPGDDTAQRVYARAGFGRVATMLHYSDPE
jgi:ribosomal protein S18 acetylase RimI-like enzyme